MIKGVAMSSVSVLFLSAMVLGMSVTTSRSDAVEEAEAGVVVARANVAASPNIAARGSYRNSLSRFEVAKQGRVAFLGGSITEMEGYRPMLEKSIRDRFPDSKLDFVNAGISSTCSTTGAFRLSEDVFAKGPVDLLFVEFAVNDDQDGMHASRECGRGLEGVLHRARSLNPNIDIVVTYFVNPQMLALLQQGKTPVSIAAHEAVCQHYNVSTVHLAQEVADQIKSGQLTWEVYGGTHPKPAGNRIAADLCWTLLTHAWEGKPTSELTPHIMPKELLDAGAYINGTMIRPNEKWLTEGWSLDVPDWKKLPGQSRSRFEKLEILSATEPGRTMTVPFVGTAIGAFVLAGPDAGQVDVQVDGGEVKRVEVYHNYSRGLHYPRTVMFFTDLPAGPHVLNLTIAPTKHEHSQGHALRLMRFAVGGPQP
ncbi:MAG: GDSL-type esterase/lipase family protein [Planctomycetaceae bacterium]